MMKFLVAALIFLSSSAAYAATVTTFSSPENSFYAARSFISGADSKIYVATYTFTSPYIARELASSGRNVTLIVEKGPVGGISQDEHEILCWLQSNNVSVYLTDSGRFMHAKYMISGSSVLVSTENLGDSGYPMSGRGNRGWGVVIDDPDTSTIFQQVFAGDIEASNKYECRLEKYDIYESNVKAEPELRPALYYNQSVYAFFSPDSLDELLSLINSARESIDVEQLYIYRYWGEDRSPLIQMLVSKAAEGVRIRVILDGSYYNVDDGKESNLKTAEYLNSIENIEARLSPEMYETTHSKAMIIDGRKVLVSSINWNRNSVMNNREAAVVIEGNAVEYYQAVFEADWKGKLAKSEFTGMVAVSDPPFYIILTVFIVLLLVTIIAVKVMRK